MIEVLENATIVYTDGVKEQFEAVYLTDKRVITGRIFKSNGTEEFKECGLHSAVETGIEQLAQDLPIDWTWWYALLLEKVAPDVRPHPAQPVQV